MNHEIQDMIDARMASFKDDYFDDQAIIDLKKAILSETRATRVDHVMDKENNVLHVTAHVGGLPYQGHMELSKKVPRLSVEPVPAQVDIHNDLSEEDKQPLHEQREQEVAKQQEDEQKQRDQAQEEVRKQAEQTSKKSSKSDQAPQ